MHSSSMRVKFGSANDAFMVLSTLEVDEELQPKKITRTITIDTEDPSVLVLRYEATDLKVLRVSMSGVMDMLVVATKTLLEFS
jgi:hypothetical protein